MSEFGEEAALRYETLVLQAVQDLFTDPNRPGSKDRSDILTTGARSYHISLSRSRTSAPRVKQPRHLLVYRRRQDGVVEVSRILHEGQDIRRHVPDEYLS
jgi:toxin ParE1/3/4